MYSSTGETPTALTDLTFSPLPATASTADLRLLPRLSFDSRTAIKRPDISKYIATYILGKPHVGVAMLSAASNDESKLTEADLIGK